MLSDPGPIRNFRIRARSRTFRTDRLAAGYATRRLPAHGRFAKTWEILAGVLEYGNIPMTGSLGSKSINGITYDYGMILTIWQES